MCGNVHDKTISRGLGQKEADQNEVRRAHAVEGGWGRGGMKWRQNEQNRISRSHPARAENKREVRCFISIAPKFKPRRYCVLLPPRNEEKVHGNVNNKVTEETVRCQGQLCIHENSTPLTPSVHRYRRRDRQRTNCSH